ncbi:MAG: group 1 truncated hemoglobin [Ectothiorhodospiraceae bacterium]|nr:group 1 truncated hemoglobin [Ectothiorhodospiraceae bacterium]
MTDTTIYERLGGEDRIHALANTILDKHLANPVVNKRYVNSVREDVIPKLVSFLCEATGGPQRYTGKNMLDAHRGMNISEQEFMAVLDDIMEALQEHGVDERTRQELLHANYGMRSEIVRV